MEERWDCVLFGVEEPCILGGVNIWDRPWHKTGRSIIVTHPQYPTEKHSMTVYELAANTGPITFAAGEFSNMCWGIYTLTK